jgi:phenylalanyl-tRNA synthetase beta chain
MNASVEWLSAFVDSGLSAEQLRDLITARVATVDAVEAMRADLANIVIGRVVEATRHPDSDHLWLTKVDAGGAELLDVICGAPNVAAGVRYPFAPVGTTMPNGMKIERRKIRGQLSNGMLCSARELGLGTDHDGVLALSTEAAPGTPLLEAVPLGDVRLVVDVMPNRPDLLSHQGLAREIAAATQRPLREAALPVGQDVPVPSLQSASGSSHAGDVRVTVDDPADCPTYLAVVFRGIKVGPSPSWLVKRLATAGVARSINNVVDVTNYLLHGYGQPAHAFDLARLAGREIHVRRARTGERLTTLDGTARILDGSILVIADAEGAQGVAGVMGGRDSEITPGTTDIVLELAAFDAKRVRAARRALGVSTDASFRFERVVPPPQPVDVFPTAVKLMVALAGGEVGEPIALIGGTAVPAPAVIVRAARVAQVLGVDVPTSDSAALLESVGFSTGRLLADRLEATPPSWRVDTQTEIDLVEEIARLRGYDSFPDTLRPYRLGTVPNDPLVARTARLRELLVGRGFLEVRPMPFVSAGRADVGGVRVTNPLADTEAFLRGDVLPSLARRAEYNLAHMEGDLRLFEIGTVFLPTSEPRPREEIRVAALCMGARRPPHFTEPTPPTWDEWDVKELAEAIAAMVGADGPLLLEPVHHAEVLWEIRAGDSGIGRVTRVILEAPPWAAPAFGVEVVVALVETAPVAPPGVHGPLLADTRGAVPTVPRYSAPPTQPSVRVDITLLVPDGVTAAAVERVMGATRDVLLVGVDLQSEYRGGSVPPGHRSVTWRLTFRHPERTLREKEVEARRDKLLRALESELGVRQRTA